MLEKKNIFISLMFASSFSDPFTLRNLLFSVGITDLILKLITVGIKILITLLPPTIIEYKGRVSCTSEFLFHFLIFLCFLGSNLFDGRISFTTL